MSGIEINKLVGAVLVALLLLTAINVGVDEFLEPEPMEKQVYPAPAGAEQTAADEAAPAETGTAAPASETASEAAATATAPAAEATTAATSGASGLAARLAAADPEAGRKVAKKCAACHDFSDKKRNKVGPALWGIVGRPKAGFDGYSYSSAFKSLKGDWTYADLDAFLTKPKAFVPGTKMSFGGLKKPGDRANLLAFLRTVGDTPAPLPGE